MKLFEPIRDSIARTDPVVKLLKGEGIQNRAVRLAAQITPLLAVVSIPILVFRYGHQLTGIYFHLFALKGLTLFTIDNLTKLGIYSGLLYFLALPTIVSVKTSSLSTQFFRGQSYDLVRVTTLDSRLRVLGILRAALGRLSLLMIAAAGLLIVLLSGALFIGSFTGFFRSLAYPKEIVAVFYYNPLPQVCLVISLVGTTLLSSLIGITVSVKSRLAVSPHVVMGIGSTIMTLLLWLAYTTIVDCVIDYDPLMPGSFVICHTNANLLLVMAAIPFGLAYGAFQLAERWV